MKNIHRKLKNVHRTRSFKVHLFLLLISLIPGLLFGVIGLILFNTDENTTIIIAMIITYLFSLSFFNWVNTGNIFKMFEK